MNKPYWAVKCNMGCIWLGAKIGGPDNCKNWLK